MEETKAYATESIGQLQAPKTNELDRLFNAISEAHELTSILTNRLEPVIHHQPQEGNKAAEVDRAPHLATAVRSVNQLNSKLKYLLDTLAV